MKVNSAASEDLEADLVARGRVPENLDLLRDWEIREKGTMQSQHVEIFCEFLMQD